MPYKIVVDNEFATVRYHATDRYIYHTFHQVVSGEAFRSIMNAGLETLQANGFEKWLSDDRNNGQFTAEDIEFALQDWGPRAAAAGWKYWALIPPESMSGRAGMTGIVEAFFNMGVQVAIFTDMDEALNWLMER